MFIQGLPGVSLAAGGENEDDVDNSDEEQQPTRYDKFCVLTDCSRVLNK